MFHVIIIIIIIIVFVLVIMQKPLCQAISFVNILITEMNIAGATVVLDWPDWVGPELKTPQHSNMTFRALSLSFGRKSLSNGPPAAQNIHITPTIGRNTSYSS